MMKTFIAASSASEKGTDFKQSHTTKTLPKSAQIDTICKGQVSHKLKRLLRPQKNGKKAGAEG